MVLPVLLHSVSLFQEPPALLTSQELLYGQSNQQVLYRVDNSVIIITDVVLNLLPAKRFPMAPPRFVIEMMVP